MTGSRTAWAETEASVKRDLRSLLSLLRGTRGPIRKKIPATSQELNSFVTNLLATLTSLTMLQQELLRRLFQEQRGSLRKPLSEQSASLLASWTDPNSLRLTPRKASERFAALFGSLCDSLSCLDDLELRALPQESEAVLEYLVLVSSTVDQLAWFLQLDVAPRLLPSDE